MAGLSIPGLTQRNWIQFDIWRRMNFASFFDTQLEKSCRFAWYQYLTLPIVLCMAQLRPMSTSKLSTSFLELANLAKAFQKWICRSGYLSLILVRALINVSLSLGQSAYWGWAELRVWWSKMKVQSQSRNCMKRVAMQYPMSLKKRLLSLRMKRWQVKVGPYQPLRRLALLIISRDQVYISFLYQDSMGGVEQHQIYVGEEVDAVLGRCRISQLKDDPQTFLRRRYCFCLTREDLYHKQRQFVALKQASREYLVTPLIFTLQEKDDCGRGYNVLIVEEYFTHNVRQVWRNLQAQGFTITQREIWYVAHVLIDAELTLKKLGIKTDIRPTSVLIDKHGQIKLYPDLSSLQTHERSSLTPHSANEIAAFLLELSLYKELMSNQELMPFIEKLPFSSKLKSFIKKIINKENLIKLKEEIPDVPYRSTSIVKIRDQMKQVQEIEDQEKCFTPSKRGIKRQFSQKRTPRNNSTARINVTQKQHGSVKKEIKPISVRKIPMDKKQILIESKTTYAWIRNIF